MRRQLALLLLPLLVLTACSDEPAEPAEEASPSESAEPLADIADIEVGGDIGEAATVEVGGGFDTDTSVSRVATAGTGAPVQAEQALRLDYAIFDAATGEAGTSTYEQGAQNLVLTPQTVIQPFIDALVGVPVGSRVVLVVPPEETAAEASEDANTAIFVLDVEAAFAARATGTPVAPPAGLPAVTIGDLGKPTIAIPAQEPPAELLVQPLVTGTGPAVVAGQTLTAMYTGLKWVDGSQFDSSWDQLDPRDFPIGNGSVIPAWDIALVGQPVGSQVLMVVPPAQGYGEAGNPQAGITGTDTLVFVVDILDARQVGALQTPTPVPMP